MAILGAKDGSSPSATGSGDRTANGDALSPPRELQENLHDDSESEATPKRSSTRRRIDKIKSAAQKIIQPLHPHPFADDAQPALNHVRHSAAFNPNKVEQELTRHRGKGTSTADRGKALVEDVADLATNPKKTIQKKIKSSAASYFGSSQQPYTSQAGEFDFLKAYADHPDAPEDSLGEGVTTETQAELLEARRDSLRTAWNTSRLRRIRALTKPRRPFPKQAEFYTWDETKHRRQFQWLHWAGHFLLYLTQNFNSPYIDNFEELPYDIVTTRSHIERLVNGSGNWQAWIMDVRSVYRWESPRRTARWLALYYSMWYINHIPTCFWLYILYHVISNRFKARTVQNVQAAAKRALDRNTTAFQLGEVIDRHGQSEWLDQLIQDVGPYAQIQLGDIANALEVLNNFYDWKSPWQTFWTLFFFTGCLTCSLFADMEFCMKIVYFIAGGSFFFCWPIASRYPQYRLLVSPFKWVFWGVPTHAEFSFQYLRKHAQKSREDLIRQKVDEQNAVEIDNPPLATYAGNLHDPQDSSGSSTSEGFSDSSDEEWYNASSTLGMINEGDMLGFRAHSEGKRGHLYIHSAGIRFCKNRQRKELWTVPFRELDEMWKAGIGGHRKPTLGGLFDSGVLQFKDINGKLRTLDPIRHRDEAFNCVIGFSGLQWQVMPSEPGKGRKPITDSLLN